MIERSIGYLELLKTIMLILLKVSDNPNQSQNLAYLFTKLTAKSSQKQK
jgi:hypothetical protein